MLPIDKAIQLLKAVRVCVCSQPCEWHGNPHSWYAFKGDSGRYYLLHHDKMVFVPVTSCIASLNPIALVEGYVPIKVRKLYDHDVCARCGIINPGKFEGEQAHAIRDYSETPDKVTEGAWRVGHRYYSERDDGFVDEINMHQFNRIVELNTPPEECPEGCSHTDYRICAEMWKNEVPI